MEIETTAIHAGYLKDDKFRATSIPIYESASFAFNTAEEIRDVFEGKKFGYIYSRIANPTVTAFELRMNALEEGIGAIATSSGMAAIATAVFTLTEMGDEIISSKCLFGGTYSFFKEIMNRYGVKIHYVDINDTENWTQLINTKTKMIFLESISNPKLEIADLKLISQKAKQYNIPVVVDNTITTPYLWRSKYIGADIIIHSATKYITGNGTAIGGILIDTGNYEWRKSTNKIINDMSKKVGNFAFLAAARSKIYQNAGFSPSPFYYLLTSIRIRNSSP